MTGDASMAAPAAQPHARRRSGNGRPPRAVVVGAGIVGSAIARALTVRNMDVTLVERTEPSAEATGASFAWINNQARFRNTEGIDATDAYRYFVFHRLALGAWRRLDYELHGQTGVRWSGMLAWAEPGSAETADFHLEMERRQRWGSPTRPITAQDVVGLVPESLPGPVGVGYFGEDEGSVDPKTAVAALLRDATSRGLRRLWPCIATDLVFQDGLAVGVETSEGTLPCDEVVFACGVETPTLARRVGLTVPLVRSSGALIELEPVRRFLQPVVRSPTFHAIQRPDGRVVLSKHHDGTPIPSDGKLDPSELLDAAAEVLPQLKNAVVERLVVGHRVLPSDGLPIVARSSEYPNVRFVAFNAGITLAPLIAELLTTEIASGVSVAPLEPYRVTRFVNGNGHPRPRS